MKKKLWSVVLNKEDKSEMLLLFGMHLSHIFNHQLNKKFQIRMASMTKIYLTWLLKISS